MEKSYPYFMVYHWNGTDLLKFYHVPENGFTSIEKAKEHVTKYYNKLKIYYEKRGKSYSHGLVQLCIVKFDAPYMSKIVEFYEIS